MTIKALNARNQFIGRISAVNYGDVVSEVDIDTPAGIVTATVTTRSVNDLGLHTGSKVVALFKATEVALAKV